MKKIILALLILGVFLIINGCGKQIETQYVCPDGTIVSYASSCPKAVTPSEPEQPTYSDCDKFLSQQEKQSCKRSVAIAIGDMSYCLTAYKDDPAFDHPLNIDSCLTDVFLNNWKNGKITLSDCEYYQYSNNVENCKLDLIVYVKKEPLLCETLSDTFKDRCYSGVAREMRDKSVCNNIVNTEDKYRCIDEITKIS